MVIRRRSPLRFTEPSVACTFSKVSFETNLDSSSFFRRPAIISLMLRARLPISSSELTSACTSRRPSPTFSATRPIVLSGRTTDWRMPKKSAMTTSTMVRPASITEIMRSSSRSMASRVVSMSISIAPRTSRSVPWQPWQAGPLSSFWTKRSRAFGGFASETMTGSLPLSAFATCGGGSVFRAASKKRRPWSSWSVSVPTSPVRATSSR